MSEDLGNDPELLGQRAAELRQHGDFTTSAQLYRQAAGLASNVAERLDHLMRAAHCLYSGEHYDEAVDIAREVVSEARSEMLFAHHADALGLLVDRDMLLGHFAEATQRLAEAMYVMQRVPNEPASYQVVHNLAVTYERYGFPVAALELLDRALRLADNELDRTYTYASMASAYHLAFLQEADRAAAEQLLEAGIYAATAALDPGAESEIGSRVTARAHRAMLRNFAGDYDGALDDAKVAIVEARRIGFRDEEAVALGADAYARWQRDRDASVLSQIDEAWKVAQEVGTEAFIPPLGPVVVDILWSSGRYEDARAALEQQLRIHQRALHRERVARWEHVQLGVSHHQTEAITEADPLTGLPNRRYLGHWLPEVLGQDVPVCVAVIDLDGFKRVNDDWSYAHGDRVLQELAGILQRVCRRGDAVVRLGGDEFVVVLRDASPDNARAALERLRTMIAVRTWEGLPSTLTLTASVGVAVGGTPGDAPAVLASAAEALQQAKREGRDRIVFR